jgi:hypothetical protein
MFPLLSQPPRQPQPKCPACGADLKAQESVCWLCHEPVTSEALPEVQGEVPEQPEADKPTDRKRRRKNRPNKPSSREPRRETPPSVPSAARSVASDASTSTREAAAKAKGDAEINTAMAILAMSLAIGGSGFLGYGLTQGMCALVGFGVPLLVLFVAITWARWVKSLSPGSVGIAVVMFVLFWFAFFIVFFVACAANLKLNI